MFGSSDENKIDSEDEDEYGMLEDDEIDSDLGRGEPFSLQPVLSQKMQMQKDLNGNLYKLS